MVVKRGWTSAATKALIDTMMILLEGSIVLANVHGLVQLAKGLVVALSHWVLGSPCCMLTATSRYGHGAPALPNRTQAIL